jgi:creatine kinase
VSDLDVSKLVCPAFDEESSKMIQSTRIRVGRNLGEFPLGPGLSKEQRNEIEEKVASALSTLEGELKGTYYSLSSLSDEDR